MNTGNWTLEPSIMIHVIATITVKPGKRDAFLAEFHRIVPAVHAEAGCIEYGPTVDVASGLSMQAPLRTPSTTAFLPETP